MSFPTLGPATVQVPSSRFRICLIDPNRDSIVVNLETLDMMQSVEGVVHPTKPPKGFVDISSLSCQEFQRLKRQLLQEGGTEQTIEDLKKYRANHRK